MLLLLPSLRAASLSSWVLLPLCFADPSSGAKHLQAPNFHPAIGVLVLRADSFVSHSSTSNITAMPIPLPTTIPMSG